MKAGNWRIEFLGWGAFARPRYVNAFLFRLPHRGETGMRSFRLPFIFGWEVSK